jgi:DivIVA domain-containing protein
MPLTPADVRNKQFSTTRLRPGYDEEEVDAFLDEVEVELDRLIQENEELRAKLAECMRGGKTAVSALNSPLTDHEPDLMAPEPMMPEPERRPEPAMMSSEYKMAPPPEDNMDTAARVLALAQQTADQAIADARREADETLGRARREADEILGKARRQAEQITSDARARAESLERDAQGLPGPAARGAGAARGRPACLRAGVPQQAQGVPGRPAPRPGSRRHRQRHLPDRERTAVLRGRGPEDGLPQRRPARRDRRLRRLAGARRARRRRIPPV